MKELSIAVYGREFNQSVIGYVGELFTYLRERNVQVYIYHDFHTFLKKLCKVDFKFKKFKTHKDLPKDISFMLSLGGDGTMLSAATLIGDSGIPIAGINFGRLGFLANISKNKIEEALDQILNNQYTVQPRALLQVESSDGTIKAGVSNALNDITVFRYDSSAMITVHAVLNGELLNSYWSDGLIIATPTGSTAYSLSCGGPIIMPGSGNFVITPVSPHNLNVRPIVVSEDMELRLNIESRTEKYIVSCDSKSYTLSTKTSLLITKAPYHVNLIRLKDDQYFGILREKLLWGIDVRNY